MFDMKPIHIKVKLWHETMLKHPCCAMIEELTCTEEDAVKVSENLSLMGKLSSVSIMKVYGSFDLNSIKPLCQSINITKIKFHSVKHIPFRFSKESEPILKKFENKSFLFARSVEGITALNASQKNKPPVISLLRNLEYGSFLSDVKVKHLVISVPLRNCAPENDKIEFLDLTGASYTKLDLSGITSLKSFSLYFE
ncbi:unnamed protein product [Ambrosiozyma monospora]|uniref:Unnamed protein product n=1 Tax=Ambrosiozyma monospora TaxID=43982 RepID=A0ACB5UDE7_AMBMO|nr:unnamed protein product [Ambrosiozyma monospora]